MIKKRLLALLYCILSIVLAAGGQISPNTGSPGHAFAKDNPADTASAHTEKKSSEAAESDTGRDIIRYVYAVGFPTLTLSYGFSTWGWMKRNYWRWSNEGWFGHGTHYGGFDKIGHMFTHYSAMRLSCSVFNYTERGSNYRFLYGALLTLIMGLSIEIGDSYSGYGFSYHDLVFDCIGILAGGLLEAFPKVDAFVSLSLEYWPSAFFRKRPGKIFLMPDDFGGMVVMANIKLAGFHEMGLAVPNFMRYIMFDIGYGVRGYTSYDRRAAWDRFRQPTRRQEIYVGISVNFMEIVKDFFKDPRVLACRATQQVFKYYHIPGYKRRFTVNESIARPHW